VHSLVTEEHVLEQGIARVALSPATELVDLVHEREGVLSMSA
jgi:hypothetical protein